MSDSDSFSIDFSDRMGFLRPDKLIDPPIIDLYLASSLTCNNAELERECTEARRAIKAVFANYDYLGVQSHIYDPAEITSPNSAHTPEEVYAMDHRHTVTADAVIFYINSASLGVGIETQLSAGATTPRIVIRKKTFPISRMFQGIFGSTLADIEYESTQEIEGLLSARLHELFPQLIESAERRRPQIADIQQQHLGRKFLQQRIRKGIRISDLSNLTDIQASWLEQLERDPAFASTMTLAQIYRISAALECLVTMKGKHFDITDDSSRLKAHQCESLQNLAEFVANRPQLVEDRIFTIWSKYLSNEQLLHVEAEAFRNFEEVALTTSDWRDRYDNKRLFD